MASDDEPQKQSARVVDVGYQETITSDGNQDREYAKPPWWSYIWVGV